MNKKNNNLLGDHALIGTHIVCLRTAFAVISLLLCVTHVVALSTT
jgi:hypothetical protein